MALSSILKIRRRFTSPSSENSSSNASVQDSLREKNNASRADLKAATKQRRNVILIACCCYLLFMVFLILVIAGNTQSWTLLRHIHFLRFDLSEVIPPSQPNSALINSVARAFGLHDFYQVGLWNYCSGFNDGGITFCSPTARDFWFNPVEVLMNELLSGQTIALPQQVLDILDVLRVCSRVMSAFFVAGIVIATLLIPLTPLAIKSRWWSLPLAIVSAIAALLIVVAAVIATAITLAFRMAAESQDDLNIHVRIGRPMFAFMWLAAGFAGLGFLLHAGMGCCCASRRDIRKGTGPGRKKRAALAEASEAGSMSSRSVRTEGVERGVMADRA